MLRVQRHHGRCDPSRLHTTLDQSLDKRSLLCKPNAMTYETTPAAGDPQHLLTATRELTRRVRREQRGAWLPLLVFAAATLAASPFYRYGHAARHCSSVHGGYVCTVYPTLALWYWPVALLLGYAGISWFYLHKARQRGVGTRAQPFVAFGVLLAVFATVWTVWAIDHPGFLAQSLHLGSSHPSYSLNRVASPAGVVGLALLLLAWIERSWLLLAITAGYLVVVVIPVFIGSITHPSPWAFLPHVLLESGVLLLGSVALARAQRGRGRPAA